MGVLYDWVARKVAEAMADLGKSEVQSIKDDLDIPIDYGTVPITRSSPGEPPRRGVKTHPLQDSIETSTSKGQDAIVTHIFSTDPKAPKLEGGGWSEMYKSEIYPRPFMDPAMQRVENRAMQEVANKIRSASS